MPTRNEVYVDTDGFRHIAKTFAKKQLSDELRNRMVLSPITILEVFSQLTLPGAVADEILSEVKALPHFVNHRNINLLPWWTATVHGDFEEADTVFAKRIQEILDGCLQANTVGELQEDASQLKNVLDQEVEKQKANFRELVERYKASGGDQVKFRDVCAEALADRAKLDKNGRWLAKILSDLSAHIEYQEERVKLAAQDPKHKPDKNDYLDSLQLIYSKNPRLHFLTCDHGYRKRIKSSAQLPRIHKVSVAELTDPIYVEKLLEQIVFAGN